MFYGQLGIVCLLSADISMLTRKLITKLLSRCVLLRKNISVNEIRFLLELQWGNLIGALFPFCRKFNILNM